MRADPKCNLCAGEGRKDHSVFGAETCKCVLRSITPNRFTLPGNDNPTDAELLVAAWGGEAAA